MEKQIQFLEKGDVLRKYIDNANNTLRLLITKKCNSKCIYCYEEGIPNSTNKLKQELDLEDFKKIILAGKELGVKRVSISGGEPTIFFSWVEELVELCHKEDLLVYLTTNATNKKVIGLAKKYPCLEFRISFDCSSREEYKHLRGIDLFDQVISIIKELVKLPNEIHINRVVTTLENEWDEFNKMIDLLNKNGLNKKNIFLRLVPSYPSETTKQLEVLDYINYLAKHIPDLKLPLKQKNLQFMYKFKYKNINVIIRTRGFYSRKCCVTNKKKCTEGIAYTRINPDGTIQPCFGSFLTKKIKHKDSLQVLKNKLMKSRAFLNDLYTKNQEKLLSQIVK